MKSMPSRSPRGECPPSPFSRSRSVRASSSVTLTVGKTACGRVESGAPMGPILSSPTIRAPHPTSSSASRNGKRIRLDGTQRDDLAPLGGADADLRRERLGNLGKRRSLLRLWLECHDGNATVAALADVQRKRNLAEERHLEL